jgi:uncharacterized protein
MVPTVSEVPSQEKKSPTTYPSPLNPKLSVPRVVSLDIILGLAVLGALFTSIWMFGGFSTNDQTGLLLKSKGMEYRLYGAINLLLHEKMKTLIAVVFGAGMILFISRDNEKGQAGNADLLMRRQMWLILFGLVNALLFLWTGDILFHLGIMGILLFPFVRMSKRGLFIASCFSLLIFCGKNYWQYADDKKALKKYKAAIAVENRIKKDSAERAAKLPSLSKNDSIAAAKKDTLTKEQQADKSAWEGKVNGLKYDPKKDDADKKEMRRVSYGKLWNYLLPRTQAREAQWTYQFGLWDFAAMILLGMGLFKTGFFNARFSKRAYFLLAVTCLAIGFLLGWFRLHNNQLALQNYERYTGKHWGPYNLFFPIEMVSLALGYMSLVMLTVVQGSLNWIGKGLAAVGRIGLTNYLLQSILCIVFFAGFGFGYFARLSQYQLYLVAAEVCLGQVVFSVLWLRYYRYGPAEWIMRCLVHKKWIPNRIDKPLAENFTATIVS